MRFGEEREGTAEKSLAAEAANGESDERRKQRTPIRPGRDHSRCMRILCDTMPMLTSTRASSAMYRRVTAARTRRIHEMPRKNGSPLVGEDAATRQGQSSSPSLPAGRCLWAQCYK